MAFFKRIQKKVVFSLLFFLLAGMIVFPIFASNGISRMVYFYNPETNINNFASLKALFDEYLSFYGNYKFQPFNKKKIFEKTAEKIDASSLFILSSWHFSSLTKKIPLNPLLIAQREGKFTFKKVLLARKPFSKLDDLANKTIASSGTKEYTLSLLNEMVDKDKDVILAGIRILSVPKDIDALMSVGFGVAQAAIATEASLKQIEQINPKLKEKLTNLLTSNEILLPIVSSKSRGADKESINKLITILKAMSISNIGKENLATLSIDKWASIPPDIMERLNK